MFDIIKLSPKITLIKRKDQIELIRFLTPVFSSINSFLSSLCNQNEELILDCTTPTINSYAFRESSGVWLIRLRGWGDPYHTPSLFGHELAHYYMRSRLLTEGLSVPKIYPIEEVLASVVGLKTMDLADKCYQRDQWKQGIDHVEDQKMVTDRLYNQEILQKFHDPASVPLLETSSNLPDYIHIQLLAYGLYPIFEAHEELYQILPHVIPVLLSLENPTWADFLNGVRLRLPYSQKYILNPLVDFLFL